MKYKPNRNTKLRNENDRLKSELSRMTIDRDNYKMKYSRLRNSINTMNQNIKDV